MSVIRARLNENARSMGMPAESETGGRAAASDVLPPLSLNADERGGVGPNGKTSLTIDEAAQQLTRDGHSWNGPGVTGTAANVTFAFRSTQPLVMPDNGAVGGFNRFTEAQIEATLEALASWSDVANITFTRVGTGEGEAAYSNEATMLFSNYTTGADGAAAFAYYPTSTSHGSLAGDVWVNSTQGNNQNPQLGNYGQLTLVHEIGHALGIAHPGDYDASDGGPITYGADAEYYEDSHQFTVMSYFTEGNTDANFGPYYPAAPMLDDIAAAQRLYGANMTTRTGDTVYGFNSTAGRAWFEAAVDRAPVFAVWDAGGVDTLDFSGYGMTQFIDLREGHFSSVGGFVGNVAIAQGVTIENVMGGSGADTIWANAAANAIHGGAGGDTVSYAGSNAAVTVRLYSGAASGGHAQGDALTSIEHLVGSDHADFLIGSAAANTLIGGAGEDYLDGLEGADTLNGGSESDRISGGAGADILDGGTGIDTLLYTTSNAGVTVRLWNNTASGGEAEGDVISNFENVTGSKHNDLIIGSTAANVLVGGAGADYLDGFNGDDTLEGGAGADRMFGGAGIDLASYAGSSAGVTVRLYNGTGSAGDALGDQLTDIEDLAGSAHNDSLIGSAIANGISGGAGDDYLDGLEGDDVLDGGDGDDRVLGGLGADALTGGAGADTLLYTGSNGAVTVRLWNNTVTGGHATGDTILGFENVTGSNFADTLIGSNAANTLLGGGGADYLDGLAGDDSLEGGAGADTLIGGGGVNEVSYAGSNERVVVRLWNQTASGGHADGDVLSDFQNARGSAHGDSLIGSGGDNRLAGGAGNDYLDGLDGADVLSGDAGDDSVLGGLGADVMDGGAGIDTLLYTGSLGGVTVRLWNNTATGGDATGDVISGFENVTGSSRNDTLIGSSAANVLIGGAGDDALDGYIGDDVLEGGAGADRLYGGAGNDTFVFGTDTGADTIFDFSAGAGVEDVIRLDGSLFADFADVLANTTDNGAGDTVISKGGLSITLNGVLKAQLHENDFAFPPAPRPSAPAARPPWPPRMATARWWSSPRAWTRRTPFPGPT